LLLAKICIAPSIAFKELLEKSVGSNIPFI
jgi:hypothetical protein